MQLVFTIKLTYPATAKMIELVLFYRVMPHVDLSHYVIMQIQKTSKKLRLVSFYGNLFT